MKMMQWFRMSDTSDGVAIVFAPGPNQYWDPNVLGSNRLDLHRDAAARGVHVGGRGSAWMYAAAGAAAGEAGADLTVDGPSIRGRLRMPRGGDQPLPEAAWLERILPSDGSAVPGLCTHE